MNLLDRLLGHDLATTRELLQLCLELPDEDMDRDIDAGWRTLRKTFDHIIFNIEVWTDLIMERSVRPTSTDLSVHGLLARLEAGYAEFATLARRIEAEGRWDDLWTDVLDNPLRQKSFGGGIGHVITHNMHHRSELLHMMQRLGMENLPEGDLMGWDTRQRTQRAP
jgi:uncharacterized damage-inducible protein DinB